MKKRILVVGAGATGGFFGAKLHQSGRDVTFLVRPERATAIGRRGMRVVDATNDERIQPTVVLAGDIGEPFDLVLLSVKAPALEHAMRDMAPAVGPRTTVVPFLNGMAHLDSLNERFGAAAVLGGVVKVVTALNEEGDIVQLSPGASITVGEQQGGSSARTDDVVTSLDTGTFTIKASADIKRDMWAKWAFISTVGALTCLARGTVGEIAAVQGGNVVGPALLVEIGAIAAAAGYRVEPSYFAHIAATVSMSGSSFASSMYRDVIARRPTEVEHILGDLLAHARRYSIETPLLDLATLALRVHEHRIASEADGGLA